MAEIARTWGSYDRFFGGVESLDRFWPESYGRRVVVAPGLPCGIVGCAIIGQVRVVAGASENALRFGASGLRRCRNVTSHPDNVEVRSRMAKGKHAAALFEVIHADRRFGKKTSPADSLSTPKWWFKGKGKARPSGTPTAAAAASMPAP